MAHSYQGMRCVVTDLPLEPGDMILHAPDGEIFGFKADVWRGMGRDERRQLREALIPTSAPAVERKRGGGEGVPPADNQQGS